MTESSLSVFEKPTPVWDSLSRSNTGKEFGSLIGSDWYSHLENDITKSNEYKRFLMAVLLGIEM